MCYFHVLDTTTSAVMNTGYITVFFKSIFSEYMPSSGIVGLVIVLTGRWAGRLSIWNAGDCGSIPQSGRPPGESNRLPTWVFLCFPGGSDGKESFYHIGDLGLIHGLERSPGGSMATHSCIVLRISMDRGVLWATVHHKESNTTEWLSTALHGSLRGFQVALVVKKLSVSFWYIRDISSTPGLGKFPGGRHGKPLQCSCLENPMERGT